MTKRVRFAENAVVINSQRTFSLTTETDESSVYESFPIACFLTSSKMHGMLSDVWDEYKIEKVELNITRQGNQTVTEEESKEVYLKFFTCFDKNRPSVNISYSQIKTMDTYHETSFSLRAANTAPIHSICYTLGQKYSSTKTTPSLGTLTMGLASHEIFGDRVTTWWSCSFRFQVSYRVARVDTGYITTMIPSSVPEVSAITGGSTVICPPCPPCPSPEPPIPNKIEIICTNLHRGGDQDYYRLISDYTPVAVDTIVPVQNNCGIIIYKELDDFHLFEVSMYRTGANTLLIPANSVYHIYSLHAITPSLSNDLTFLGRDNTFIIKYDDKWERNLNVNQTITFSKTLFDVIK